MRGSVLFVLACLARPAAADEPVAPDSLFPLAIGNAWTYKVSGQDDRFVVRVADQEMVGSQLCFKLEASLKDKVVATEHVAFTKAGLCRFRVEHEDVEPPVCVLKAPAGKGTQWPAKYTLNSRSMTANFLATAAPGELVVPAGKFKAVKVDVGTWDGRGLLQPRATVWYAPGVGPVRQAIFEGKSRF